MIISFLIDSRYGGPQMINNHLDKNIFKNHKTIFFDKKNRKFKFFNLKKKIKIFFLIDVIFNLFILQKNKKFFLKYKTFFVYSILNIIPIIFGILLKKKIIWYILEQPNTIFYFFFKILLLYSNIKVICISDSFATEILQRDSRPGVTLTNFWKSKTTPTEYDGEEETLGGPFILHPPKNGSIFRMVEFEPEFDLTEH